jgi:hypothetical protein
LRCWRAQARIWPTVFLEDLDKLDIRVGTIERVEDIKRSGKLARLLVDFGDHKRTILKHSLVIASANQLLLHRTCCPAKISSPCPAFAINLNSRLED